MSVLSVCVCVRMNVFRMGIDTCATHTRAHKMKILTHKRTHVCADNWQLLMHNKKIHNGKTKPNHSPMSLTEWASVWEREEEEESLNGKWSIKMYKIKDKNCTLYFTFAYAWIYARESSGLHTSERMSMWNGLCIIRIVTRMKYGASGNDCNVSFPLKTNFMCVFVWNAKYPNINRLYDASHSSHRRSHGSQQSYAQ